MEGHDMDIFTACRDGNFDHVHELLEEKEELANAEQNKSSHSTGLCGTPLMFAVRFNQLDIATLLIDSGADINRNRDNRGCLSIAIEENLVEMVDLMLENDIVVNENDFMLALTMKTWNIASILLKYQFNMFHVGTNGSTFLHVVVSSNVLKLAEEIMSKAPRLINIKNANGKLVLTIAQEKQLRDMIVLIKKHSTKYQLESFKSISFKKYEECMSAITNAEESYNECLEVVENIKSEIEETRLTLKNQLIKFETAQKQCDNAKEIFEETMENVNKKIVMKPYNDLLECPICMDIPFHPRIVFQCDDGHVMCSLCREKINTCPECRCDLRDDMARNRRLEALIEQFNQALL